jgi:hypothetical protein
LVIQLKANHIQVRNFKLTNQFSIYVTVTFILVLLPVEDHNTPIHLKAIEMFPLLVTQLQEASSSVLELDNNYLPTEEELETKSNSPFSETGKGR